MEGLVLQPLIRIEDFENNDLGRGKGVVDGKREGIDGLHTHLIITNCGSYWHLLDFGKIPVNGIGKLKAQSIGYAVIIFHGLIDFINGINRKHQLKSNH